MKTEPKYKTWLPKLNKMSRVWKLSEAPIIFELGMPDGAINLQFLGIKNKNGEDVFEGDLLKHDSGVVFQYKWDSGQMQYYIASPQGTSLGYDGVNNYNSLYDHECETIGNVYENPELL